MSDDEVGYYWKLGKDYGIHEERERTLKLLESRICFDYKTNGTCDNRECYGNLELIELIKGEQK